MSAPCGTMVRLIKEINSPDHWSKTGKAEAMTTITVNTGTKAKSVVNVMLAATCGTRSSSKRRTTNQANATPLLFKKPCHHCENGITFSHF